MLFPKTFDAYLPSNNKDLFEPAKNKLDYVRSKPYSPSPSTQPTQPLSMLIFLPRNTAQQLPLGDAGHPQITFAELNRQIYHTSILHDLGWTTTAAGHAHLATGMTFELHGGIMVFKHLRTAAPELDIQQVSDFSPTQNELHLVLRQVELSN
ncbi:hypothetical protein K438DRAFT_1973598 [Mycena galopus ATCC 62051]|nr:hypothetical protein K438DRAFT_1973598 [Mycena galopus ATCC 62051]